MADNDGYHSNYSAYGGRVLTDGDAPGAPLADLGITDAEQLIALAAVPGMQQYLEEALAGAGASLDDLLSSARDQVPAASVSALEAAPILPGVFALGAEEPTAEIEQEISSMAYAMPFGGDQAVALPSSVNFARNMPPIRNQGSRGTCVAHALTAAHEYWRKVSAVGVDLSEQFLYEMTKRMDGSPNTCGTWQVKAAQVLARSGQSREVVWPYNPSPPCNNNGVMPGNAMADAGSYRIQPIILQPRDVGAIKAALAGGSCVGFSIAVYNSWYQSSYARQTGRLNMRVGNEPSVGGHAMCFIGYQDDAAQPGGGVFILRNSWSQSWGAQCPYGAGNGTIPYAYMANEGWEAVAMPPPRRRLPWPPRPPRPWPFNPNQNDGGDGGEDEGGTRQTLTIDTGGRFDIVIR